MPSRDATSSPDTSGAPSRVEAALTYWRRADRGWKAVCLSAILLAVVQFGVRIPW